MEQSNITLDNCLCCLVCVMILCSPLTGHGQQAGKSEVVLQLLEELQQARRDENANKEVDALSDLAVAYHTARLFDKAAESVSEAESIIEAQKIRPDVLANFYNTKAVLINGRPVDKRSADYDRKLYNRRMDAINWVDKVDQLPLHSEMGKLSLAWSYCLKSQYFWQNLEDLPHLEPADSVVEYVQKALSVPEAQQDTELFHTLYGRLTKYYLHFGQLDSANFYLNAQKDQMVSISSMTKTHYYLTLHEYFVRLHGLDTLLRIRDSLLANYTEVLLGRNSLALFDKDQKYEATKAKNDLTHTKKRLNKTEKAVISVTAVATMFLFAASFIFVLYRKNLMLSKRNEELVREQNHRVKNNLQMLSSMFSLQAHRVKDADVRGSLLENEQRVNSLALLHRRLYDSEIINVNVREYLEEMVSEVVYALSTRQVNLSFEIEDITLKVGQMVKVGLIVNELVTNSIKHAFEDQQSSEIRLTLSKEKDQIAIAYSDSGQGMSIDEFRSGSGFGTELIESQIKQLRGSMEIVKNEKWLLRIRFEPK